MPDKTLERFILAALSGPHSYANGDEALPIPERPGWKGYVVKDGIYHLTDSYTVLPSGFSFGETLVWVKDLTRFMMVYQGQYKKEAMPFLRTVLRDTYERRRFEGGRGTNNLCNMDYVYLNDWRFNNGIAESFSGVETVLRRRDCTEMGRHHFWGFFAS